LIDPKKMMSMISQLIGCYFMQTRFISVIILQSRRAGSDHRFRQ